MTLLTVTDLFTPAPSGVGAFGQVPLVPPVGTWLATSLNIASTVGLPTTSWQPGAPERTILAIESVNFSQSDVNVSTMAQGGFLQSAASGTVTFTSLNGTVVTIPVTPDPSNAAQNPTGALGWLDLLTSNVYDVDRLASTFAIGPLAIVNTSGSSKGPFGVGAYHVANTATGATYSNQAATLTIPSSAIAGTGGVVVGVQVGISGTIIQTQSAHGFSVNQVAFVAIPTSSGVTGLANVFAIVAATTPTTFQIAVGSSGLYTSGGTVYLCTVATMTADVSGIGSNAGPAQVTTTVTQNAGVFCSNVVAWSGSNWETNTSLASRAQLSLAKASPNGPSAAYVYFADTAQQILLAQTPPYVLTNGPVIATEFANPQTGIVTTVVASATPASTGLGTNVTPGFSQDPISGVTNANPAVITCTNPTGMHSGDSMTVAISGALGVAGVNGTFLGTYTNPTSFSIPVDTTSAGTYLGGGSVEGGDLGQIDLLLQQNVVPDGITAITQSALALPITIVASVAVPQAFVATYQLAVVTQLQVQIASYAVGGNAPSFEVAYDDIIGALEEAGVIALGQASYVRQVLSLSINGGATGAGVPFPSSQYQAILSAPTVSVLGV